LERKDNKGGARLRRAYSFAAEAHRGQLDESGLPVIWHPMAVAKKCDTTTEKIVALLHDVIEDTEVVEEEIRAAFGDEVADAVVADSRVEGEEYEAYLDRVAKNPLALKVKIADLRHNIERGEKSGNLKRLSKHKKGLEKLLKLENPDG